MKFFQLCYQCAYLAKHTYTPDRPAQRIATSRILICQGLTPFKLNDQNVLSSGRNPRICQTEKSFLTKSRLKS